nr:hypothetical protein [Eubacterium sp.]
MNILEKGSVSLAIMIGCLFLLTSCGDVQSERMSPSVTGSAVSVSTIAKVMMCQQWNMCNIIWRY